MTRTTSRTTQLRRLPLFAGCTTRELAEAARCLTRVRLSEGAVLMTQGASPRAFYVLVEGSVAVDVGGRVITRLSSGDFVGEVALLDRRDRTATVIAETDVVAETCSPSEFASLLVLVPAVRERLLVGLAARLRSTDGVLGTPGVPGAA